MTKIKLRNSNVYIMDQSQHKVQRLIYWYKTCIPFLDEVITKYTNADLPLQGLSKAVSDPTNKGEEI